jgi:DNA-directed RNA polymerase II subunit RPB1
MSYCDNDSLRYTSKIERVTKVQFSLMSPQEIRERSVVEITRSQLYDGGNTPCAGGLFDTKMGGGDGVCTTDQHDKHVSPGYFGHIELAMPVFYVQFIDWVKRTIQMVCFRCAHMLLDKKNSSINIALDAVHKSDSGAYRFQATQKLIKAHRCKVCPVCEAQQPSKFNYIKEDLQIYAEWSTARKKSVTGEPSPRVLITPEYALMLFKRISDTDCYLMGFDPTYSRPEWMICTVLPVCPPCVRPSVKQDGNQRQEDDLTHKLVDITKCNETLKEKLRPSGEKNMKMIDNWRYILQYHIATYVDNECGLNPAQQRTGRAMKALRQRLKTKEGRIRGNLMGKRTDFSARSVITPDPVLQLDQLGVPVQICQDLTIPERVNHSNLHKLRKAICVGVAGIDGAKIIEKASGKKIALKYFHRAEDRLSKALELRYGDIVHRHLKDNDRVLFNRQPSLHRMSMMCHRVKRINAGKTFRLNVDVTTPYNADFDGDEMNMHVPQSIESANELEQLAPVYRQLIGPGDSRPCVTPVQDTMVGAFLMTNHSQGDVPCFTPREYCNVLLSTSKTPFLHDGNITGQQALASLLPDVIPASFHKRVLTKSAFGSKSDGLIHIAFNDDCPRVAQKMLDDMRGMITAYMHKHGFSVGMVDLKLTENAQEQIKGYKAFCLKGYEDVMVRMHQPHLTELFGEAELENAIRGLSVNCNDAISRSIQESTNLVETHCRFNDLVDSGSKGNKINIRQMMGCLGQQEIDGKRIANGLLHRTLPHFSKYDMGIEARGYVQKSFLEGLTPQDFFFHAMGGREGLIDTAVKTASTGYIQRRLIKSMEDLRCEYDETIRNTDRQIVQFLFAEDGMDNCTLELQSIPFADALAECNVQLLKQQYSILRATDPTLFSKYIYGKTEEDGTSIPSLPIVDYYLNVVCSSIYKEDNARVTFPVHVIRILDTVLKNDINKQKQKKYSPKHLLQQLDSVFKSELHFNGKPNGIFKVLVYGTVLQDKYINQFSQCSFSIFISKIVDRFQKAKLHAGEMVGVISAQSIGEPATQMTLNTFHYAGVGSKSKITRGVPRLTELMIATRNPKTPAASIVLNAKTKEDAEFAKNAMEITTLTAVVSSASIFRSNSNESGWYMQLELSRMKLFEHSIELIDVVEQLIHLRGQEMKVEYCPENMVTDSNNCIIKISMLPDKKQQKLNRHSDDDFYIFKTLETELLGTVLQGVCGLSQLSGPEEIHVKSSLETGHEFRWSLHGRIRNKSNISNVFASLLTHPLIDSKRTITNHVIEVLEVLGIEAARQLIIDEIHSVITDSGSSISIRHIMLLADYMTCPGTHILSVDRNGMKRTNAGPLAKCSFEETDKQLYNAAVFSESDNMSGVSSNIMLGQAAPCGTGLMKLQMDIGAFMDLQAKWRLRNSGESWDTHVARWKDRYSKDKVADAEDQSTWNTQHTNEYIDEEFSNTDDEESEIFDDEDAFELKV